jgi:cellulose synthase/poly-beta-1,6-N-acetylglucosamine synthase-like glycosyltransferase
VTRQSGLFESCNLAVTRKAFEEAGGFGMDRPGIPAGTRAHFGEDVEMGWRIRDAGRRTSYCPGALVHHRQLPATYLEWLGEHRRMALFPGLVRRVPGLGRELLRFRVFLSDRTALFDLAAAGVALAVALRRPWLVAASLPWLRARWREAGWRGGTRPLRVVQLALGDIVGLASLVQGSARSGRLVL